MPRLLRGIVGREGLSPKSSLWDLYSVHLFSICLSNLQNRDEWAQKEGKLWVAWVEVDECEGLVEMKAGSHLWREGLLISPFSISPGGEERWLGGGGRGRVSRSMSCSVETLSLRFPHICPSGKRWNEDKPQNHFTNELTDHFALSFSRHFVLLDLQEKETRL